MVQLEVTDGTSVLGNVLSFNCSAGRRVKSETYSSSSATIVFRVPSGLPALYTIGRLLSVNLAATPSANTLYSGYIADISYNYGIVTAMDTATITLEGYLAFLGRGQLNSFALTGLTTGEEAQRLGSALSGSAKTINYTGTRSLTDTSSYTGAGMNVMTELIAMEQGRLIEGAGSLSFTGRDITQNPAGDPYYLSKWKFTDSNPATNGWAYDDIEFGSLSDNYFTQVTVTPQSVAAQSAGTGSRNLSINTYDPTTTQAANLALYALNEFNSNTSVPVRVSTKESLPNYQSPSEIMDSLAVGWQIPVTFRGSTYQTVIEGWNVSATPEDIRYTVYLSGFEQNNYMRLSDAVYGVLDSNQLSF